MEIKGQVETKTDDNFISTLYCANCSKITENPMMITCCSSVVCRQCKDQISKNSCLVCKSNRFEIISNQFLTKITTQIKLDCKYNCGYKSTISDVQLHELTCQIISYKCTYCNFQATKDEFLCHVNMQHPLQIIEALSANPLKQQQQKVDIDPMKTRVNRQNNISRLGKVNKYYCGNDIGFRCGCCTGCGPTNGDNCLACMILDVQTRQLPKGYLVNKYGATAVLKGEAFSCGLQFSNRKVCGVNYNWCDGCDSLSRNKKHYYDAYSK